MSDEKLRLPVNPLHVLYAMAPILALAYLVFAVIYDFSKIGDIPIKPRPVPKPVSLPGRAPGPAVDPPARTLVWGGGYASILERLRPLHKAPAVSRPGLRLSQDAGLGQTFDLWRASGPRTAQGSRRTIAVQPIGKLTSAEARVVALTAELLGLYFGLPVKALDPIPVDGDWPKEARRADRGWGPDQLLARYILDQRLKPLAANGAAAVLGLTAHGLWAGDSWTFVYGGASPAERVAVLSISRNGELTDAGGQEDYLRRTFKAAIHEIGHMFSMDHCTAYACAMRGAGDLNGVDARPMWLCPECETKLLAATGVDPAWHYERLAAFFRDLEMGEEAWFYDRSLYAARKVPGLDEPFVAGKSPVHELPFCTFTP